MISPPHPPRTVLFSGHRIDPPDAPKPRFPSHRERAVQDWLAGQLRPEDIAISSLADGGDILFAEACRAKGLIHHILLPLPPEAFLDTSVAEPWRDRFHRIWNATPPDRRTVLPDPGRDPFDACNRAMIALGLTFPPPRLLLVIWSGKPGRRGGTASMVALAHHAGIEVRWFDPLAA